MKIAILSCSAISTNGYGNITVNYCDNLYRKKIQFILYLPYNHKIITNEWSQNIKYCLPKDIYSFNSIKILNDLFFDISEFKNFSLIHSLFTNTSLIIASRASSKYKIPLITGEQGTYAAVPFKYKISALIYKKFISQAKYIIFPSDFTRKIFCNFYGGINIWKKTLIIENGVDFKRFNNGISEHKIKYKFVGIGALKERKGFEYSINAIALARKQIPNISYTIIGGGPEKYKNKLEKIISENNLESCVQIVGPLSGCELINSISNAYAYLHTPISFNWNFEGYGIVYSEANALGMPVIGSDSGGVSSAIKNGVNGYITQEANVKDIYEKILDLCEDELNYINMSEKSIQVARNRDWNIIIDKYINIYMEVSV
jgi:glycosyltransferase involved in cell wall biosynthesis